MRPQTRHAHPQAQTRRLRGEAPQDIRAVLGLSTEEKDIKEILKLELNAETHDLETVKKQKEREMKEAALRLEFELAAILRDEIHVLDKEIKQRIKIPKNKSQNPKIKRPPRHGRTH